jgi:hypothetical protein
MLISGFRRGFRIIKASFRIGFGFWKYFRDSGEVLFHIFQNLKLSEILIEVLGPMFIAEYIS